MKEENEITEEVKQLLETMEQHGRNARRQKELGDLIDRLAEDEKPAEMPHQHSKLIPLWWAIGAAAAVLLLWLLARPALKETPDMDEKNLVEETNTKDTMTTQKEVDFIEESVILEEPVPEQLLAEETPTKTTKPQTKTHKSTPKAVEEIPEEPILAENTAIASTKTETIDTSNIGSNTIPNVTEEPVAVQSPQRRVVRSLNLVCYECQKEPENNSKFLILNSQLEKTIFGQPQDPNMKNGSLAFELKLH